MTQAGAKPTRLRLPAPDRASAPSEEIDEISYSSPGDPALKRFIIRLIERLSGQPELKRMYLERKHYPVPGESFWNAAIRKLRLTIHVNEAAFDQIPATGPVVVVANHPFGVIDGLVACWLTARVRTDFKVLAHVLLTRAVEVRPFLLPIDFEDTKAAIETNVRSRAEAVSFLKQGGALIVFPSGAVSTTPTLLAARAVDPDWKAFAARLILQAKAPVVPIFFYGQNSRLFQTVSHFSMTLRLALLLKEAYARIGTEIRAYIGQRIPFEDLALLRDRKQLMESLRRRTYALAAEAEPRTGEL